ncbi:MAG: antitoxin of toxin-antitoxin stability system [Candidatus Nitrotoga sp.]|nr:antitoxin of toxin-antitoxin stability system [Candidatus Nitrotoga sp.]RFC37979.1 MAG: hypothetical protein DID89_2727548630 [Candidatus Nitrotoga sp. CP45]MDO9446677.1 antitoxin of toxin-antitoxin stability system [Candidatus Nitrotoga sp.]MDP1638489.1 antitoxin of toxin-antitoxin stability system [Candidatus Nitrotoga sp.]MDP1856121.1 antitoxin of toxin-antitoxin stability system [Candidatus Nitrotoga sp.]
MSKEAVFTMKLEPELRTEFMAAAEASHRPASQILRELMRDFVQRQREAREYDDFLRRKVEKARAQIQAGEHQSNEDVSAEFAAKRAQLLAQLDQANR